MMKRKVKVEEYKGVTLPSECPRCDSDDLAIDNTDGMQCLKCGCWFDAEPNGDIVWAYDHKPTDMI